MESIFTYLILFMCLIAFYILARATYVLHIRTKILYNCSNEAKENLNKGDLDWEKYYAPYDNLPSFDMMMIQFWKWKY